MTTDHDIIARACRRVDVPVVWKGRDLRLPRACVSGSDLAFDNPALHTLLVFRLAMLLAARPYVWLDGGIDQACIVVSTGGHGWCVWRELGDGSEIGLDKANTGELREPIDIIRVLVDALEEGE